MRPNYFKKDLSFESMLSVSAAVENLENKLESGKLTGTAKPDSIILCYRHPFPLFSRGIRFTGSITAKDDVSTLTGTFRLPTSVRFFMNSLLLLSIFLFFYSLSNIELMIIPIFIFILWLANFIILNRWWKIDSEYISQILTDALNIIRDEAVKQAVVY